LDNSTKILRIELWDLPEVKADDEVILCMLEVGGRVKINLKFSSMTVHRKDLVPKKYHTTIIQNSSQNNENLI